MTLIRERLEQHGVVAPAEVLEDYPPTAIVDYAARWQADFIVVGSHGTGIKTLLPGSVSRSVSLHATCSVEVVRPRRAGATAPMKILLATDGSDYSVRAAESVASRAWPQGTEVRVMSAVDLAIPASTDPWCAASEVVERLQKERLNSANQATHIAAAIVSEAGMPVTEVVLDGGAKWQILDEARTWGADLVVLGSHGRRGFQRLLLGSVSEAVAMHADCSVDIIRGASQPA